MAISLRTFIVVAISILCITSPSAADSDTPVDTAQNQVKVGMFVTNLYDINFSNNEFKTEFWAWFLTDNPEYQPAQRTEIVNSKQFSIRNATTEKIDHQYWHSIVFKGTVKQQWDVTAFPFDKQLLQIHLEDTIDIQEDLRFQLDSSSSIAEGLIPMDGFWIRSL